MFSCIIFTLLITINTALLCFVIHGICISLSSSTDKIATEVILSHIFIVCQASQLSALTAFILTDPIAHRIVGFMAFCNPKLSPVAGDVLLIMFA